jgi:hypothetical protein
MTEVLMRMIGLIAAVLALAGVVVGCSTEGLMAARPAVTAIEGGLVAAGQPAAAGAVEVGFHAWEAALYALGAMATGWGAKAGVRAVRKRTPKAAPRG